MRIIAVIPARLTPTSQLLSEDTGKPLIAHTVAASKKHFETIVTTDSPEIYNAVRENCTNAPVVITGTCPTGTDRVRRAVHFMEQFSVLQHYDIVINWQANFPELDGGYVAAAIKEFDKEEIDIVTIAAPATPDELTSAHVTKVVTDHQGMAMYFSRSPIPHNGAEQALKHIGVYAFRQNILASLGTLDDSSYPSEQLEQIQWLEAGLRIMVCVCPVEHAGISTPEQYRKFVERHALQI